MAILETAIMFKGDYLIEEQYYSTDDVLDKNIRTALLQALQGLAIDAFGEELQSFSLGEYAIVSLNLEIGVPMDEDNLDILSNKDNIMIYSIINKNSDEIIIKKAMNEVLNQFLNRYSVNDIFGKKIKKFRKFNKRLNRIFGDLVLKSEDRFKSLF